jgi:hypothetical protein
VNEGQKPKVFSIVSFFFFFFPSLLSFSLRKKKFASDAPHLNKPVQDVERLAHLFLPLQEQDVKNVSSSFRRSTALQRGTVTDALHSRISSLRGLSHPRLSQTTDKTKKNGKPCPLTMPTKKSELARSFQMTSFELKSLEAVEETEPPLPLLKR